MAALLEFLQSWSREIVRSDDKREQALPAYRTGDLQKAVDQIAYAVADLSAVANDEGTRDVFLAEFAAMLNQWQARVPLRPPADPGAPAQEAPPPDRLH